MKVLVIGSGGREHTLIWKIKKSPLVDKVYCAPGNAGIAQIAECIPLAVSDLSGLLDFACTKSIDLTVVGPELPLTLGIVDEFNRNGLKIFGVNKKSAQLEGSKVFMKELMSKYRIPTAGFRVFTDAQLAKDYVRQKGMPLVVKADGLAAGKGVVVCRKEAEARQAIDEIMERRVFGAAGDKLIIEDCLAGEEVSFLAFTDGKTVLPMVSAQDHKAIFDGDNGPNTGGMGAYSPAPLVDDNLYHKIMERVMLPTVKALAAEGYDYRGVLYAGLMIIGGEPYVLEFNARFGDPETQVIVPRLASDIVPVFQAVIEGKLAEIELNWRTEAAVCVVLAAGGYPGKYGKGDLIGGWDKFDNSGDLLLFHAGTANREGGIVSAGGRVLGITALHHDLKQAIASTYTGIEKIQFKDMYYRKDIGHRAIR
ncbi:MAG: phosphoribosylamine--glycine ligase [Candidatus Schekmanbacteria bacterium]|nr:phosphoribosylamine--glycine ligase [Candidatus Schekmanbacteria bacterium]